VRELSLHLLDIAENSAAAQAKNITITVVENSSDDRLEMSIEDDGKGMDEEMVKRVVDPFVTSRTTRKVGLGLPLLKENAEACNGHLEIQSTLGKGTSVFVDFQRSNIDRMPLGDLASTWLSLLVGFSAIHWTFRYQFDQQEFVFDDQLVKETLDGISLSEPSVLAYLREQLELGVEQVKNQAVSAI
jgi:hypothetical protein